MKDNTLTYFNTETASPIKVINERYKSPISTLFGTISTYSGYGTYKEIKNKADEYSIKEYKVIVEEINSVDIRPYVNIMISLEDAYRNAYGYNTNWENFINFSTITSSDISKFMEDSECLKYVGFCLFDLVPDKEFKRTNVTSKIIEAGKCTGVSVSKSKTDKDCYVIFQSTNSNTRNVGVIFFKKSESYAMLRLALGDNLKLGKYTTFNNEVYDKKESE